MTAIRLYRVRTRKHFIDNIPVYLFAFGKLVKWPARRGDIRGKALRTISRELRVQNSRFAREIPTCRECPSWSRVHYVDVNNIAICNNSAALPIRPAFLVQYVKERKKVAGTEIGEFFRSNRITSEGD